MGASTTGGERSEKKDVAKMEGETAALKEKDSADVTAAEQPQSKQAELMELQAALTELFSEQAPAGKVEWLIVFRDFQGDPGDGFVVSMGVFAQGGLRSPHGVVFDGADKGERCFHGFGSRRPVGKWEYHFYSIPFKSQDSCTSA